MNRVMRILNVAEKNDAAKMLAKTMSRDQFRRRDGLSKFNQIYEYSLNLFGVQCQMVMTSVSGHLMNFDFTAQYKNWNSVDPLLLFTVPVYKQCLSNEIYRTLQREARTCQKLIIWTDCDREGENIGFEVIEVVKKEKPNIEVYRARFSEITDGAVQRALRTLGPPDANVNDAVEVRQELDLRIGAAFTRFQTMRLQQVFPAVLGDQKVISYGSCQFPTLGFVVERYKEIESFVTEPFWKLKVTDQRDGLMVDFSWKRGRLFDEEMCRIFHELCLEEPRARVTKVQSKPKTKWRPVAMDTIALEKLASRKLGIGAKETMKIAESLYTKGFISYPRTETNIFPKDLELQPLVRCQTSNPRWGDFAARLLDAGLSPHNGRKSDQAHPPIHPLKAAENLPARDAQIYELVTRHFLACLSADAVGEETVVEIDVNKEEFQTKGLTIRQRNYLEVYPYDTWTDKELPVYRQHEVFAPAAIDMVSGATEPPRLLTEADLITLMEKHGIGTDATHADHIETIKKRNYVGVVDGKAFLPGELGMGLVEGYDAMGFHMSKPHLRAELEHDLQLICQGVKKKEEVLALHIDKYRRVFEAAVAQDRKLYEAITDVMKTQPTSDFRPTYGHGAGSEVVRPCHRCGSDMRLKQRRNNDGFFVSCSAYPACRNAAWLPTSVEGARLAERCPNHEERVMMLALRFRRGAVPPAFREAAEFVACVDCEPRLAEELDVRYSCPAGEASASNSGVRPRAAVAGTRQPPPPPPPPDGDAASSCNCGVPAVERTVQKEGPNRGRKFLSCAARQCNFFQWTDTAASRRPPDVSATSDVVCGCGAKAKLLTVMKESPNRGRPFFCCAKPRGQGCNFFQWADESAAAPPASRPANRPAERQSSGGRAARQRLCGICRQAGHNRNNCPHADAS